MRDISRAHTTKRMNDATQHLCTGLESGKPMSGAMQERPDVFPGFYVQMIRAGELSGTLDKSINSLLDYLGWQSEFRKTLRSYYTYPLIVLGILLLLAACLFIFVLPGLLKIFTRLKVEVPLPTKILLAGFGFVQEYYVILGLGLLAAGILLKLWSLSTQGRRTLDNIYVSLPVIGQLVVKINLSRYFKVLATLHGSGIDIQEAFGIASSVIDNTYFREKLAPVVEAISSGEAISTAMARTGVVDNLVVEMIAMGEKTGTLDNTLLRICEIYDREVPETTKRIFTFVEPMIVLIMGFMVLMVLLAIFLPIYGIVGGIKVR
jgi:type II secretory pathway component PulF